MCYCPYIIYLDWSLHKDISRNVHHHLKRYFPFFVICQWGSSWGHSVCFSGRTGVGGDGLAVKDPYMLDFKVWGFICYQSCIRTHQGRDWDGQRVVKGSLTQRRRPKPTSASSQGGRLSLGGGQTRPTAASGASGESEPETSYHAHFILSMRLEMQQIKKPLEYILSFVYGGSAVVRSASGSF